MSGTKEDIIKYRIEKSLNNVEDAKSLANIKSWNFCLSRLYFSSFTLIRALLLKNNINTRTHNGLRTQFNNQFVKTGLMSIDDGRFYSKLFDWKQTGDYEDFVEFDKETVMPLISQVEEFNKKILELILSKNK